MSKMPQISSAELEIMNVLWEHSPLLGTQIVNIVAKTNTWGDKTIRTFINRLVGKGAVSIEKLNGRTFLYSAAIDETEYKADATETFLKKMYGGSLNLMLTDFVNNNKLSRGEIDELEKILEGK